MDKRLQKEFENSYEYLLPDYMGDVKKLLTSDAKASVLSKFVGEGSVEVSGSVEYELIYVDADGKLTPVKVASDFSESFEVDSEKYVDSKEEGKVLNVKARVTGPRKIVLRADTELVLHVSQEEDLGSFTKDAQENPSLEKCMQEVKYKKSLFLKSGEREYAEILERLDGEADEGIEVLFSTASAFVSDISVTDGRALIKGENTVSAIIRCSDSAPRLIKKSFPFEEEISSQDIKSGMFALGDGYVSSVCVSMGSDGNGSALVGNIIAEYSAELMENVCDSVITDGYIVDRECKNSYKNSEFSELVWSGTERFKLEIKRDKEKENLRDLFGIISSSAQLRAINIEGDENGCHIGGEICVSAVGYETNVDGTQTYIPIKIQDEFSEKVNIGCQITDKNLLDADLSVCGCDVVCDSESFTVCCNIIAKICVYNPQRVNVLTSCEPVDEAPGEKTASQITVYYPKAGERLFDVAKKYKTTSKKIAEDNLLVESALSSYDTADSLMGVKKLIIR